MESTTYRHLPFFYEAVEISKILAARANGTIDSAPKWIRDAIFEGKLEFPSTAYCLRLNVSPGLSHVAAAREYLMRGPKGQLHFCPPETLAEFYELASSEAGKAEVSEPQRGIRHRWPNWNLLLEDMIRAGYLKRGADPGTYFVSLEVTIPELHE